MLALGVGTALTLTSCGSGPDPSAAGKPSASKTPAPQGIITTAAAKAVVDAYESANNQANKTRDEKLLATVESGQVNEQSRADYKQWSTWSAKDKKEYGTSFFYQNRTYYIPAAGTADWFAVKATSSYGDHPEALLFFDTMGGTYKMTMAFYTPKDEPFRRSPSTSTGSPRS
jgi:hypothetical protein